MQNHGKSFSFGSHVFGNGVLDYRWGASGLHVSGSSDFDSVPWDVLGDGNGGLFGLYSGYDQRPPFANNHSGALVLRRMNGDGTNAIGWPDSGIKVRTTGSRYAAMVPLYPDVHTGVGIAIARRRNGPVLDLSVFAQRVLPSGAFAPGWSDSGVALCTDPGLRDDVVFPVPDGKGGMFVV